MKRTRRGTTIIEVTIAAILIGSLLSLTVTSLAALGGQRRAVERRAWAMETAAGVLERLTVREWDAIAPDISEVAPPELNEVLPGATLDVDVSEIDASPPAKRMTVTIAWDERPGVPAAPVRLTAWVHRSGEDTP